MNIELLGNITAFAFVIGMVIYCHVMTHIQDKKYEELIKKQ